jgi:hypothetical protein
VTIQARRSASVTHPSLTTTRVVRTLHALR